MTIAVSSLVYGPDPSTRTLAAAARGGLPLELAVGPGSLAPSDAARLGGVAVDSLALERGSPADVADAVSAARALAVGKVILPVAAWPAAAPLEAVVAETVALDTAAYEVGVRVLLEMPAPGTCVGTQQQYAALSRLLVRHRLLLSVELGAAVAAGLNPNQYWRYFASRIAHVRLDPAETRELAQWRILAAAYGYPGSWVIRLPGDGGAGAPRKRVAEARRALTG